MISSDEDSVSADAVHVDASSSFQVVDVNETVLGHQEDDIVFLADLHRNGEIVQSLGRKVNIHSLLGKGWVALLTVDFNDVELEHRGQFKNQVDPSRPIEPPTTYLGTGSGANGERKQFRWRSTPFQFHFSKAGSVTFDRLADSSVTGVQLHGSDDTSLLQR